MPVSDNIQSLNENDSNGNRIIIILSFSFCFSFSIFGTFSHPIHGIRLTPDPGVQNNFRSRKRKNSLLLPFRVVSETFSFCTHNNKSKEAKEFASVTK